MTIDLISKHEKGHTTIYFKCLCNDIIEVSIPYSKNNNDIQYNKSYDEIDVIRIVETTHNIMQHITKEHGELYAYTILEQIIKEILKGLVKTTTK